MKNKNKVLITMEHIKRFEVLQDLINKKINAYQAAELLNLSYVHTSRLKSEVIKNGFEALLRKPSQNAPNQKFTPQQINIIIKLRKNVYFDLNVLHFQEKLEEIHLIKISYESLRQILINNNLHNHKKRKLVHRTRKRMPKTGMLVQMDSSEHLWLPQIHKKWFLIAMIDDASNEVPIAKFFPKDNLFNNMFVIRNFIEKKGIFTALYPDKASHFTTTRHSGLHYNCNPEQEDTQIERALNELNITLIPANSPQAKGRIERLFRTLQDRLIKEMRLANIQNYEQANLFLTEIFLPWYNNRFSIKHLESSYKQLPKETDLNTIFCIKNQRTVKNDNTVSFKKHVIQISPSKLRCSFARLKVEVCLLEDNSIFVLYQNQIIAESRLPKNNKYLKKQMVISNIMEQRNYKYAYI